MTDTLLTEYLIPLDQNGAKYPTLQVDNYRPASLKTALKLIISTESKDLICADAQANLKLTLTTCDFGDGDIEMFVVPADIRFVILAMPKVFAQNKKDKQVYQIQRGDKFKELNRVSIAKLLLAAVVDGKLILDDDGLPQIFTLKLLSTRTQLIESKNKDDKTIKSLNIALQNHYKAKRQSLTHLVSVNLAPVVTLQVSATDSKTSSFASSYELIGDAIPLTKEQQGTIFHFVTSDEFKAFNADPFGILGKAEAMPTMLDYSVDDEIAF
jgi:hypothetical protein